MNRIYRTLWSVATQSWQAVPETAKTAGKKSKSSAGGVIASYALGWVLTGGASAQAPPAINQLPTGGTAVRGTASIQQTATAQAAAMTVNQTSQRAVVNWNTFNIGSAASVNFVQPNAQAVTLNRVNDSNPSQIFGRMSSNGQVVLTNANGIYFAPGSSVDVGAITATTHSITDDNFMSGKYVFVRNGATGKIINEGNITAALAGYVALLAPEVQNAGIVVARAGTVAMAAGETITLNIDGAGSLAGITTTPNAIATLIENKHAVQAPDGQIILSAVALNKLQAGVIKNSGSLEANSLVSKGGKIYLEGDDITLASTSKLEAKGALGGGTVLVGGDWQGSGEMRQATKVTMEAGATIDASATDKGDGGKVVLWSDIHHADSQTMVHGSIKAEAGPNGGDGGKVETSGHYLNVDDIQVSTQSKNSATGEWLLDPWDITIASSGAVGTTWNPTGTTTKTYTSGASSTILDTSITGALNTSNVVVSTGGSAGDGNGSGNITVATDLSWSSAYKLTFTALGGVSGTGNISMTGAAGAGLIFNQVGNSTYSGNISGANATLTKQGTGTLSLTGNNSYGGGTTLTAGVLNLGSANAISNIGTISFGGGTLQHSTNNTTDYSNRFGATGQVYNIDTNGNDITLVSALGAGSLTKLGSGTLTLTGSDTNINAITISGGSLQVGNGGTTGALRSSSSLTVATTSNTALIFNHSDDLSFGSLTINGAGGLTQAGSGALNFTANTASYGGPTYVKAGTLNFGTSGGGGRLIVDSGATFKYTGPISVGSLSGAGTVYGVSSTGSVGLTVGGDNTNSEFSGVFMGGASGGPSITKTGTGTFIYTGSLSGSFYGISTANSSTGTLQIGNGGVNQGDLGSTSLGVSFGSTVIINRSDDVSIAGLTGSASGSGTFVVNTPGTVTLTRTGSFAGTVLLNSGTLSLSPSTLASTGTLYQGSGAPSLAFKFAGGTLKYSANDTYDYSVNFSNVAGQNYLIDTNGQTVTFAKALTSSGGSLTKLDSAATPGTLILKGANTYNGTTTISAGALEVGDSILGTPGTLGAGTAPVVNNGTLKINSSYAYALTNSISGSGNLIQAGSGTTTVSGTNSFIGGIKINAGTLILGSTNALGNLGAISFGGGTLQYATGFTTDYSNRFDTSNGQAYRINTNGQDITFASALGGVGSSLSKLGLGTLTLNGDDTYSGVTTLSTGTLKAGSATAFGTGAINVASGAVLDLNGQTMTSTGGLTVTGTGISNSGPLINSSTLGATYAGLVTLGSNITIKGGTGTIALTNAGTITGSGYALTLDGAAGGSIASILGTGAGTLTKAGASTWTLSGANTYTGTTTVSNGTLTLSGANTSTGAITISAGSLIVAGSGYLGGGTYAGTITNNGTFQYSSSAAQTLSGVISGTGTLTKDTSTSSTLTLTGTSTYTGNTNINAGTLVIGGGGTLGSSGTYAGAISNSGTFKYSSSAAQTLSGVMSGSGTLIKDTSSTSTLTLAGINTYTGNTTITLGALSIAGSGSLGSGTYAGEIIDNGTFQYASSANQTLSGRISGAGSLTKSNSNSSTLTLNGDDTYSGTTTISAGTLMTGSATAFGTSAISVSSGAVLDLNGQTMANTTGTLTLNGTGISSGGALINTSTAGATYASLVNIGAAGSSIVAGSGSIALTKTGTIGGSGSLTLGGAAGGTITSGIGTGGGSLTKQDAGTWTLNGINTYTGATTITAGTLIVDGSGSLGGGTYAGAITNNGTFQYSSSAAQTLSGVISGTGTLTKDTSTSSTLTLTGTSTYTGNTNINAGTLAIGGTGALSSIATSGTYAGAISNSGTLQYSSTAPQTLSGVISGTGTLNKVGGNTLTLTGINTYTGNTTITGSTLAIGGSGSLGSGTYAGTITDNGTFQYSSSANQTLSGRITGTGGLTKDTSTTSTLTITGTNNDYLGYTIFGGGTLALGANNALPTTTVLKSANATGILDLNGYSQTVGNFYATDAYGWTVKLGSGTLTVGDSTASVSTGVKLTSTTGGGLTKVGSGTISFSVASTYNGTTQIDNGALGFANNAALTPLNIVRVNSLGTLIVPNQSTGQYLYINSLSGSGTIKNSSTGGQFIAVGGDNSDSTFSGTLYGGVSAGGLGIIKNGSGKFTFTGSPFPTTGASFFGYTVNGGTLQIGDGTTTGLVTGGITLANNSTAILNASGNSSISGDITGTGTLKIAAGNWSLSNTSDVLSSTTPYVGLDVAAGSSLDMGTGYSRYVSSLSGTGEIKLSTTNSNYKLNITNATDFSFSGLISGTGGITKSGAGMLTLTGNNTYSGLTTINAGKLKAGSATAFGSSAITETSGAVLDLNGQVMTSVGGLTLNGTGIGGSGALINSSTTGATYAGLVTLGSATTITGGIGAIALNNASTITGSCGLTLDGATGGSITSIIGTGTGALTKAGTGTWTLGGANTYTGTTTISAGTLQVGSLSNATAKLGAGAITDNGNLIFYRSGGLVLSAMAPNTGAITGTGNVTLQSTDAVTVDRAITLTGANSAIYVEAGVNAAANTSLVSDVTLSSTITTSATGTIAIFEGSPTATVANGSTTNLSTKMAGATGSIKYKTYNASLASLSTVVAGTRNFYYRLQPSFTITGATVSASKTYDGTTTAANAVVTGGTPSSATDGDHMGFAVTGATYDTPTAGTNKSMTVGVTTASTDSTWVVKGYSGTMSGATYAGTINKAVLSITANNDARFVTQTDNSSYGGVYYSGFVNGENTSVLGGSLSIARSNPTTNTAGNYTLTPSGFTSDNYSFNYRTGSYTIIPANQLLVRVADATTVYGTAPTYSITSAQYVMPDNSLIDLTSQLTQSGNTYTLNDGASGSARFALGASNPIYSASGNLNVGVWSAAAIGASTTSPNFSNTLTVVGTQTVTPRALTVSAAANNKVYDGTTTATLSTFSDNRVTGDALSVTQTSATFASKNAAAQQTVTISGVTLSGADAGNYTAPADTLTATADITQKALSLSGLSAASKTYDGTTSVVMNSYGTLSGVVGSEVVQVDNTSAAAAFATKNAGIGKTVNITGLALGGADIANYSLANPFTTTADITAKALTVTGTSVANKTYDATTTTTLTGGALSGLISGDVVTLTQAGSFVDKNYSASAKTVNAADTLSGTDASNYSLTQPTGLTGYISKADLAISGVSAVDKTYNATTTTALTGTATATPLLTDVVTVVGTPSANFTTKDAGTGKTVTVTGYTLTGLDADNYNPVQPTGLSANISKANLTVTGISANDKVYDATLTATLAGTPTAAALLTDSVSVTGIPTASFADKNVSASAIGVSVTGYTLSGTDAGNYEVVQPSGLSAFITPKALTLAGLSAASSKIYDGNATATVIGNGGLLSASAAGAGTTADGKPYVGDLLTVSGSPVGTYNSKDVAMASSITFSGMSLSGAAASNYTLSGSAPYAATITPKDLTVKANNDANFFAINTDTVGFNGVSYVGFITGESASNLSFTSGTAPTVTSSLSAGLRSTPGTYTGVLAPGGINAGNYHPVYQPGDFTVVPADTLLIRAGNTSVAYGASASLATPTASYFSTTYGFVGGLTVTRNGDAFNVSDLTNGGSATVTLAPIATSGQLSHSGNAVVGIYDIGASSVTNLVGNNFSNSVTVSGTQTITPKSLTISASAASKTYDGSNTATVALSSSDAIHGDALSYEKTAATFSDQNVTLGKTVTVRGMTLGGTDADNYSLQNTSTTTTADITRKVVALTATKAYDGTTALSSSQVIINTGVGSETLTYSGAALASKNVASNASNTVASITLLDGTGANAGSAGNYTYTTTRDANNSATVTPANLTLAAVTDTKVYDGTRNSSQTVLVTNNSGSSDVVSAQQEFASKNVLGSGLSTLQVKAGYTIKDSNNADMSDNYVITSSATATGTITPADIAITGITAANKVYDATLNASLVGVATVNALGNDVLSVSSSGTGQFADKNAGNAKPVSVTGYTLTGADANNYNVLQPSGLTADISKAGLTVSAVDAEKLFGNVNPVLTVTLSGFVGGETLATSGVTGSGLATTSATLNTNPGTAVINAAVGTLTANNYDFTRFVDGALTIKSIGALNNTEVTTLISSGQLAALTSTQMSSFNTSQLQIFSAQQLSSLSLSQVNGFSATQIASLSNIQLLALSPAQVSGLSSDQLSALSPAQISLLTGNGASNLSYTQVLSLSPSQMAAINPTLVARMTAAELGALSDAQLQALTPTQLAAIAPNNFAALTPEQIMAMSIAQVQNLTPEQLASFTPIQIASLSAAELAYFDARQLAAIGIFPKVETPTTATNDKTDNQNTFEAPIPVMTEVAKPDAPAAIAITTLPATTTATERPAALSPRSLQALLFAPTTESSARSGVLAITILNSTEAKPVTAGVAFEQDADTVSLRYTSAPSVPPISDKVVFSDKLITFMVATPAGEMVEFEGNLVNNRMVIVAPSVAAKRVARTEMNLVLAAAVTSLGKERRVMLANLTGVLLDLR